MDAKRDIRRQAYAMIYRAMRTVPFWKSFPGTIDQQLRQHQSAELAAIRKVSPTAAHNYQKAVNRWLTKSGDAFSLAREIAKYATADEVAKVERQV